MFALPTDADTLLDIVTGLFTDHSRRGAVSQAAPCTMAPGSDNAGNRLRNPKRYFS
ncbi:MULTISPECIES: hypothetical protein [Protofrankia]|uniref:hypothetical protein n=1 Tax=Protofrankia TaxID=2994361 RepID=UPI000A4A31C9|nr:MULTISPECIES: hypothetical protein [Protofrankia]